MSEIKDCKSLLIAEMQRVIGLLKKYEPQNTYSYYVCGRAELKGKMKEIRRDMIEFEKLMYKY